MGYLDELLKLQDPQLKDPTLQDLQLKEPSLRDLGSAPINDNLNKEIQDSTNMLKAPAGMADNTSAPLGMGDSLKERSSIPPQPELAPPMGMGDSVQERSSVPPSPPIQDTSGMGNILSQIQNMKNASAPQLPAAGPDQELDAAMKARDQRDLIAQLGMAGEKIGSGISGTKYDPSFYQQMARSAPQPIEDVLLKRKVALEKLEEGSVKYKLLKEQQAEDPKSPTSEFIRNGLREFSKASNMGLEIPDTLSAADMERFNPLLVKMIDTKGMRDARLIAAQGMYQQKQDDKQSKSWEDFVNKAEGVRAPPNIKLAKTNLVYIANARKLINDYPDLNKMPQAQVNLLVSELSKIAGGGVATGYTMKELNTNTYNSRWKEFMGKVKNNPTGAQLAPFIQQNVNYINGLESAQNEVLNKFIKNEYEGHKPHLNEELMKQAKEMYPGAFTINSADLKKSGDIIVREKASGRSKRLDAATAAKVLKDPAYEQVK